MSSDTPTTSVEQLLRDLAPQVLSAVARRHEDFAAAEDAVQEALFAAAQQWPAEGIPANPRGWLYHVTTRRLTDHLRSELARRRREDALASHAWAEWSFVAPPDADVEVEQDDALVLLFMCCHPALTLASAVALTLRAVGGLTTSEIAGAFFVPEATMAQRISRAKQTIQRSGIPFRTPTDAERAERLRSVLHILYLIFNEGYASSAGPDLHRTDLSGEAIRLTRMLRGLLPNDAEVSGLLALMLLTDARRAARTGEHGELIPLDEQDRSQWDRARITEGLAVLDGALKRNPPGPYQIQAAIAALHDEAPSFQSTDWPQILALYTLLEQLASSPMVLLSQAVAIAMVHGPNVGLDRLTQLEAGGRLIGHYRLDAVRAHLFEMAGHLDRASAHYRAAAARTASLPEQGYLLRKASSAAASHVAATDASG
ncbi:RNA polymerase sigma factor [Gemmatimonas sp. UBA7669]|uniref:RNA polymerase sigma factor n=1 Tax=Gemmatimonas sp. UBA7669 TaxID=1946568 RepID=UPI0025C2263B|nr:DUF6596 domain-containing protein [Gemmatimonas sp. UBA7669]